MVWDGIERRDKGGSDHDVLIRIDANLKNFLENFHAHVEEDKNNFDNQGKRIWKLEKAYWIGVGIIIVVNILLGILTR